MWAMGFKVVCTGLAFPEGPRWHEGALWFSDMHAHQVMRMTPGESPDIVVDVPEAPSGLGFLPDGRLLVVSMHDRKVMRLDAHGLVVHADLSKIATWHANDMLVDATGRAYVGNFGDDSVPPAPPASASLALIQPDGSVEVAADAMAFANGMTLIDGGRVMVVAETRATPPCLTAFDVDSDGHLSNRRVLVAFDGQLPDGISADADDHVWVASPFTNELLRVSPDGRIVDRLESPHPPYACAVGGDDGRTLFVCAAGSWREEDALVNRDGVILAIDI